MARQTLDRNVKFKALVKTLGLPRPYVRGLLEMVWDVAHECGNPVIGGPEDIELAAEWPGEPGLFFEAMKKTRLIDEAPESRWVIHDYWDHAPDYVRDRRRKELERKNKDLGSNCPGQTRKCPPISSTPAPAPTQPKEESAVADDSRGGMQTPNTDDRPQSGNVEARSCEGERQDRQAVNAPRKPRKEPTGDHAELVRYFCRRWSQRWDAEYPFQSKDGVCISKILSMAGTLERAEAAVAAYIADGDQFIVKERHGVGLLLSGIRKYLPGRLQQPKSLTHMRKF